MAITVGTPTIGTTGTTSFTNGAATSILIVGVAGQVTGGTGVWGMSATYAGAAMTNFIEENAGGSANGVTYFYLTSPSTGANNVVVTPTSGSFSAVRVAIVEVSGQNVSPAGATQNNWSTQVPSTTLTTTGINGVVFDFRMVNNTAGYTVGTSQTELFNVSSIVANYTALGSYETYSSGNVTMSWSGASALDIECVGEIAGVVSSANSDFFNLM